MTCQLYPLRFEPIYQYRLWGGRRFENLLFSPLPGTGPIGEAWILSDRDDHPSHVADGPLKGKTIGELIASEPGGMLGRYSGRYTRFPLLLKFLDAREMLSVQVHPTDEQPELLPSGESGKTEAWLVLEAEPDSKIYAGLEPGTTYDDLRHLAGATADRYLASFQPRVGDCAFIPAGTVHALGGGVVVFEVQENSDVTFRLYDWDRIDSLTGQPRELHIEKAIQCIDLRQGPIGPITPKQETHSVAGREKLLECSHFTLWRTRTDAPSTVGAKNEPRLVVCVDGSGTIGSGGESYAIRRGDVFMLPAAVAECSFKPSGETTVLEIALPAAH